MSATPSTLDPGRSLLGRTFRASPAYELVGLDALPPTERRRLGMTEDVDAHAILRPLDAEDRVKALCRGSARLFASLAEPGPLSPELLAAEGADEAIARLVLDGVLEVRWGERFVSGPDARPVLGGSTSLRPAHGHLGRLSLAALEYGARLPRLDPRTLSGRLYGYNRAPITAILRSRLPDDAQREAFLGLRAPALVRRLDADWTRARAADPRAADAFWMRWVPRAGRKTRDGAPVHKLYVSPPCDHLREVLPAVVDVASEHGSMSFKIGRGLGGLLRPDKLVMYFASARRADAAAATLARRLAGTSTQGVPFTVAVDDDGLVSRGMDPPRDARLVPWHGPSWRRWITDRLALALVDALALEDPSARVRFALERLRVEGIDPSTFAPDPSLWRDDQREDAP